LTIFLRNSLQSRLVKDIERTHAWQSSSTLSIGARSFGVLLRVKLGTQMSGVVATREGRAILNSAFLASRVTTHLLHAACMRLSVLEPSNDQLLHIPAPGWPPSARSSATSSRRPDILADDDRSSRRPDILADDDRSSRRPSCLNHGRHHRRGGDVGADTRAW
jgi:hypothetical protein